MRLLLIISLLFVVQLNATTALIKIGVSKKDITIFDQEIKLLT